MNRLENFEGKLPQERGQRELNPFFLYGELEKLQRQIFKVFPGKSYKDWQLTQFQTSPTTAIINSGLPKPVKDFLAVE